MAPPQSLLAQNLADSAASDRDALDLAQIDDQPIERPGAEGEVQFAGRREGSLDHHADIRRGIDGRPTRAGSFFQSGETQAGKAIDPRPGGALAHPQALRDFLSAIALIGKEDDLRAFDATGGQLAGSGLAFELLIFLVGQRTDPYVSTHGEDLLPENGVNAPWRLVSLSHRT